MKRTILLALVAFAVIVAAAVAAAPTASIEDVTQTSMKLTKLDCGTNWNIRLRRIRADGTYGTTQTLPPTRTLPCSPPPPPPPPPPPDPTPPPTGTEPAPIAGQGYHEAFRDDFDTLNRFVWDDHIWYDDPPSASWTDFQTVESGILHLRSRPNWTYPGCSSQCWPINTATTHTANLTYKYGYFEARMNWTGGKGSWPAFWLISEGWADTGSCSTPAGEIDVMEGQGEEPNVLYGTVHKDSAGACSGHDQNGNNWQPQSFRLADNWHTYGLKWTPTTVTWYLDGVQTHSAPTYPDDNQPMHVLLQMWNGGWHDDADATSPNPLETQVDYVTVWQQ